jgi:hypothetical protein
MLFPFCHHFGNFLAVSANLSSSKVKSVHRMNLQKSTRTQITVSMHIKYILLGGRGGGMENESAVT